MNQNIPTFEKLGLPPTIEKLCHYEQGMVLLAGVTGSGKSTTIASMLDYMNEHEALHILTIEDPIEFVFTDKMSVVNQREVYLDVSDWHTALKHAVREDPDVILVGEMRDADTFEAGRPRGRDRARRVRDDPRLERRQHDRPHPRPVPAEPARRGPAVARCSTCKAVVAQKLVPSIKPGVQRVPTNEIMIVNPTIRDLILKSKDEKLLDAIRVGSTTKG